jgi:uncharacterized protein (TIGR03437 family)
LGFTVTNHLIAIAALVFLPLTGQAQAPPHYTVTTIAGNNTAGYTGDGAAANAAQLDGPSSVWLDSSGNIYIADQFNHAIRKFTVSGNISTIAGESGHSGYAGDGAAATAASLYDPTTAIVDSKGNLYIADTANNVVRMVAPGGTISTIAGNNSVANGFQGDGGPATSAQFNKPAGLAIDSTGNLYIADANNHRVRKVVLSTGIITTFAGSSGVGFKGDGGPATQANLTTPIGLALDSSGALYIADAETHSIRKVAAGVITTVAGSYSSSTGPQAGFTGDGGQAANAQLRFPRGVALDSCGNLFIADTLNNRIRMVMTNGVISTIAGSGNPGQPGYGGDGGPATSAQLYAPSGVAVDASGKVYIADTDNNVVRLLTPDAAPTCAAGPPAIRAAGVISASDFGGFSTVGQGSWIEIYGTNLAAETRLWTLADFKGVNAPLSLDRTTVTIGGEAAFIDYVSPTQVNAQVPFNIGTGSLPVVVSNAAGVSAAFNVNVALTQPGLFAPASFNVGGIQYVGATLTDGVTFIAPPGTIPGHPSRQAKPGETIILYGVGFGPVNTGIPAGQIVQQSNSLSLPISIFFGGTSATLQYYGLAGGFIGLYEFYVVVPNIADSNAVPLTFTLNGVPGSQTLYTAVKR